MTKAIDNVVAHFDAQEIKKIEVKEWGTEDQPLEIFTKPLTLQESKKLYKMANGGDLEVLWFMQSLPKVLMQMATNFSH